MPDVNETVEVHVPIRTAYDQWTQFESFPRFMDGVESVRQIDDRRSHWVVRVGGVLREFDTEITERRPDERIAWKSIGGNTSHAGAVTFHRLSDQDTQVTVQLSWHPDGLVERVGSALSIDDQELRAGARRFKEFIEHRSTEAPAPEAGTGIGMSDPGDVFDVLLGQHEQIKALFEQVRTASGDTRQRLFDELTLLMDTHEHGEQRAVHPAICEVFAGGAQVAATRVEEEAQAGQAMAELKALGAEHPDFEAKFAELRQAVLAHARYEEQDEFPWLREQLSADRLAQMADELRAAQNPDLHLGIQGAP